MRTLESRGQLDDVARAESAILFIDFDWSGQAALSRSILVEWERTWAVWSPRVRTEIWRVSGDKHPWFGEWLPKDSRDLAGAGHGAVVWLRAGRVVGHERGAYAAGIRQLARRTDMLFGGIAPASEPFAAEAMSPHYREVVSIDLARVENWDDFHSAFSATFGFPSFYGKNMDAWVDCMTDLDDPYAGMTQVVVKAGKTLTLDIRGIDALASRCPDIYMALTDAAAFVNWRRGEQGQSSILILSYNRSS